MHLKKKGIILGGFWQLKCLQNPSEILEAILEAKKGVPRIFWGRPGGMRGVPGEDNGGVREPISAENRGREPRPGAMSSRLWYLARRPRGSGGSLRAFRRARVNSTLHGWRVASGDFQISIFRT